MKVDTILVGLDIDHDVNNIVDFSLELAILTNAQITFLHVFRPDIKSQEEVNNEVLTAHFNRLKKLVTSCPSYQDLNHTAEFIVETGFAMDKLLSLSEELQPDILLLGTAPSESQLAAHFASIARSILNHWHGRVLLVPNTFKFNSFNEIVFTVDFRFHELDFLMDVLVMAELLDAHVTCLHIITDDEDMYMVNSNLETLKKLFHQEIKQEILSFTTSAGRTAQGIQEYLDQSHADMVCMVSDSRSLFGSMISPSTAFQLSKSISVPIFIAKSYTSDDLVARKLS